MNYFAEGFLQDEDVKEIEHVSEVYSDKAYEEWPEKVKLKIEALQKAVNAKYINNKIVKSDSFWITIGGPVQTLATSFTGLFILFIRQNKWKIKFKTIDWLAVFMALFALREVFNFVQAFFASFIYSESNFYGDEFKISRYLGFNEWVIPTLTLLLGLFISLYIIFKVIPLKYRFSFIISGFIGGVLGFSVWFGFLGEFLFR